jgi:hypothetical protein
MKMIGTFGLVVIASIPCLQSAHARGYGGGRSFSSAPHFSAPSAHYSGGGSRNFSPSRSYYAPGPRYSSGATYRNRGYAGAGTRRAVNRTSALNPRYYSTPGSRSAGNRRANLSSRDYSTARLAANRTGALRSSGFNGQGRVVARHGNNWHRNWDRSRDHYWNGHRCHWHNNSWIIFDTGFYPWGWGYYPYGSPYYYDDGYYGDAVYDERYAANEYAPAQSNDSSAHEAGSRVSDVQSALARAGYYDGAIDGVLGPGTRKALRNYQRDHGLEVTGGINRALTDALQLR